MLNQLLVRKIAFRLIMLCAISLAFTFKNHQSPETGFALVELFTSEGCSSCPPADALIAKIEKENKDKPIYILAYHVDYWDRLGWKDTFSDSRYSERQKQYATWLKLSTIYRPQIVVNGRLEFVGSQERTLHNAIAGALSETNNAKLEVSIMKQSKENLTLSYHSNRQTQDYNLDVALIGLNASNKIERGENKGKTLSHVQIVRNLEIFKLDGKENGTVNFHPMKEISQGNMEIIAFLQNVKTGKITAAAKVRFKPGRVELQCH